jgi:ATP-dependent helicase HepA
MSQAEPELGLGTVLTLDDRNVTVLYSSAEETRRYAIRSAPLRRVRFGVGERLSDSDGNTFEISGLAEEGDLIVYLTLDGRRVPEPLISDNIALSGPRERLLDGRVDSPTLFSLRLEVARRLHQTRRSIVRGFVGPRLELLPHQFYIASEITSRRAPRLLLADETGLGKTIEACLTINRLLLSGRASRILILVPDSLVHQWLVELRRRFGLRFAIVDEERCQAITESEPGTNPFLAEQLVIAGLGVFTTNPLRAEQAAEASWDLVVVDEAHHLVWSASAPSPQYSAVEKIVAGVPGLLLLTATPEQLGEESHFARLRLLDPDRYDNVDRWREEAASYRDTAETAQALVEGDELSPAAAASLGERLGCSAEEIQRRAGDEDGRHGLLDALIDRHGPGRVMFRNTRASVSGFPSRDTRLHPLDSKADARSAAGKALLQELNADLAKADNDNESDSEATAAVFSDDERVDWVVQLMASEGSPKILVICRTTEKAQDLKAAIERRIKADIALFHEDLTLVQRDRNAAWFAEPKGAQLLICSEIGSEGRNFQHAQNLVMFDLPLDPDLVEQRIGRLDRIGQRGQVTIHAPFMSPSGGEILARWHHEGIGSFNRPSLSARPLLERFGDEVIELALQPDGQALANDSARFDKLLSDSAEAANDLASKVEKGRDRLLELASLRPAVADRLIQAVREHDSDEDLEDFFLRLLEHFHVYAEETGRHIFLLNPDGVQSAEFPALARGETAVTLDRDLALVREDLEFITQDHEIFGDAMERLLASESGNATFALVEAEAPPQIIMDSVYILETVAPASLHIDRFLPPTPLRLVVDHRAIELDEAELEEHLETAVAGKGEWLLRNQEKLRPILAKANGKTEELAELRADELRAKALKAVQHALAEEIERLRALALVNDQIRPEEIDALVDELKAITGYLGESRLRLDSVRLVWRGPYRDGEPLLG